MITALRVCEAHYGGWQAKINGCDKCPIRPTCLQLSRAKTLDEIDRWKSAMEKAALEVEQCAPTA